MACEAKGCSEDAGLANCESISESLRLQSDVPSAGMRRTEKLILEYPLSLRIFFIFSTSVPANHCCVPFTSVWFLLPRLLSTSLLASSPGFRNSACLTYFCSSSDMSSKRFSRPFSLRSFIFDLISRSIRLMSSVLNCFLR